LWRVLEHVVTLNLESFASTYSVNFPMWFNTLGGNIPPVSELMWRLRIALSNSWVCSINSIQILLFRLAVWNKAVRFNSGRLRNSSPQYSSKETGLCWQWPPRKLPVDCWQEFLMFQP
jgi:hypothetical protein